MISQDLYSRNASDPRLAPGMVDERTKRCNAAYPWWCGLIAGQFYIDACREARDVRNACIAGYFPPPPQPPGPTVPSGGYTGAVTDPGAIDRMIAESKAKQNEFYLKWFSTPGIAEPPEGDPDKKDNFDLWIAGAVVLMSVLVLVKR